ncbi:MAG: hypothetical protein JNM13_04900 [Hyphomicrobiaceae bacterium]|nr:hypothetical protein [Hyphomicrobiaceae bacterium]
MTGNAVQREWPVADVDKLDREIGKRAHRISSGNASATDVSEATRLIRERADLMMPGVFVRLRKEGVLKKSG